MKKIQRFLPFIILLSFVAVISIAIIKSTSKQNLDENQLSNEFSAKLLRQKIKLPEFSLPDLFDENKNFSTKDLINDKKRYSVINFFASWCVTCLAEHEALMHLQSENIADVYGVAWRDFGKNTIKFLDKNGNPFKKVALDAQGLFTRILGIKAVPETVIVDPAGNVILRYQGNLSHETVAEIKNFLSKR
ncbi:MAG: redoxin domain-containing protein [Rickettsiales bacterium]|nr:redoxin domain-containing protein [Rickettsiales bacterium]